MAGELFVIACHSRVSKDGRLIAPFSGTARVKDKGCSETITSLGAGIEFHSQKNQASGFPDLPQKSAPMRHFLDSINSQQIVPPGNRSQIRSVFLGVPALAD